MLKTLTALFVLGALFLFWRGGFERRAAACAEPITYTVGTFDRQFDLSAKDFLSAVAEAEAAWERPSGRALFAYSPEGGDLRINLIYDYRQAVTEELNELEGEVKEDEADYRALESSYLRLKAEYGALKAAYEERVAEFEARTAAYDARVESWNSSNRRNKSEFQAIEAEKAYLSAQVEEIRIEEAELNEMVRDLNALVSRLNRLAKTLNLNVDQYNTIGASRGETFAGGTYSGGLSPRIDIYEFESREKLVRILAHELGHALGLEHIGDKAAIMYYLNEAEAGRATAADLVALEALCAQN